MTPTQTLIKILRDFPITQKDLETMRNPLASVRHEAADRLCEQSQRIAELERDLQDSQSVAAAMSADIQRLGEQTADLQSELEHTANCCDVFQMSNANWQERALKAESQLAAEREKSRELEDSHKQFVAAITLILNKQKPK